MGPGVTINAKTGLISGIAPKANSSGEFVVTVCVTETRGGVFWEKQERNYTYR
jgi:hypothetical protein